MSGSLPADVLKPRIGPYPSLLRRRRTIGSDTVITIDAAQNVDGWWAMYWMPAAIGDEPQGQDLTPDVVGPRLATVTVPGLIPGPVVVFGGTETPKATFVISFDVAPGGAISNVVINGVEWSAVLEVVAAATASSALTYLAALRTILGDAINGIPAVSAATLGDLQILPDDRITPGMIGIATSDPGGAVGGIYLLPQNPVRDSQGRLPWRSAFGDIVGAAEEKAAEVATIVVTEQVVGQMDPKVAEATTASANAQSASQLAGSFLTLAAAQAALPAPGEGKSIEVTADGNNNGRYAVRGGVLVLTSKLTFGTLADTVELPRQALAWVYTVDWLNDGTRHHRRNPAGQLIGRTTSDGVRYSWAGISYQRRDRTPDDDDGLGVAQRWTYTVDWTNTGLSHSRRNAGGQVVAYRDSKGSSFRWDASGYLGLDPGTSSGDGVAGQASSFVATVDWLNLGAVGYRRTGGGAVTGLRLPDTSERRWTGQAYATIGGVDPLPPYDAPMGHLVREEAVRVAIAYIRQAALAAPTPVVPAEAAAVPVPNTDVATYGYGRSGTAIPNADWTYGGRKFRANVQRNDKAPGSTEDNGNPVGGEGPGAYVRIGYSDDGGATWTYCRFFLPVDMTKSVLDPYVKRLVDGRMLFLIPTSGSARRAVWGCILENPDEGSGTAFTWGPLRFLDYGFASVPEYVNGDLLWLANEPIVPTDNDAQEDWRGAKLCRIRIYGNEARSERISRLPWVKNQDGTASAINSFQETSIIAVGWSTIRVPFRTADGYYQTISRDAGMTWSAPTPWTAFPAIASRHHFARSPRGVLWCAGYDVPLGDARRRMMVRGSLDDGETWPAALLFCFDPREPASYPRLTFARTKVGGAYSGDMHVDYDRGRGRVADSAAPTGWLSEICTGVINEDALLHGVRTAILLTTER